MCGTKKLLQLIKRFPALYDLEHKDYRNMKIKDQIWAEIGRKMQQEVGGAKEKWRNMRDTYRKHLRSLEPTAVKGLLRFKHWQWGEEMDFLKPFIANDGKKSKVLRKVSVRAAINSGRKIKGATARTSKAPCDFPVKPATRSKTETMKENDFHKISFNQSMDKTTQYVVQDYNNATLDATELIFLGYAKTVKTFSPKRQAIAKIKVAEVLLQQELEHQEEDVLEWT